MFKQDFHNSMNLFDDFDSDSSLGVLFISRIYDNCSCKSFSTDTFCETHAVNRRFIPVLIVIMSVRTLTSSD